LITIWLSRKLTFVKTQLTAKDNAENSRRHFNHHVNGTLGYPFDNPDEDLAQFKKMKNDFCAA